MFERCTKEASEALSFSQDEAWRLDHHWLGTEHLLLGLLRESEGVAARSLTSLNVTLNEAREKVASMVGYVEYGEEGSNAQPPFSFTQRSKNILELALNEAKQLGHNYVSDGHLLLGLLKEGQGVANRVLEVLGADQDELRRRVLEKLE